MEYRRPTPGVPDASGPPTMTPPSHDELVMAGHVSHSDAPEDSTRQRPYQEYVRIHHPGEDKWRPAVICFPPGKGSSYCVVHTPADHPARVKKHTHGQYNVLCERTREWDAPRSVKQMVWQASGGSSQTARSIRKAAEIADCHVLSYVMRVVEEAEETGSHHADRIQSTLLRGEGA